MFSHLPSDKACLLMCHLDRGRTCVSIYCASERPGQTSACCFALGNNILLHPASIKNHKELVFFRCKTTLQMSALYIVQSSKSCLMFMLQKEWFAMIIANEMGVAKLWKARQGGVLPDLEKGTRFVWSRWLLVGELSGWVVELRWYWMLSSTVGQRVSKHGERN